MASMYDCSSRNCYGYTILSAPINERFSTCTVCSGEYVSTLSDVK